MSEPREEGAPPPQEMAPPPEEPTAREPVAPPEAGGPIGARHVVLVATAVVALVLGLQVVSTFVPAIGDVVGLAPVMVAALVVVTAFVLIRVLRRRDG